MARQETLRGRGEEIAEERVVDERSPLLSRNRRESSSSEVDEAYVDVERTAPACAENDTETKSQGTPASAVIKIVAILLVGTFTANADGSLVMATHPTIASEFDDLENSSWLFVAFALAGAATQTLVDLVPLRDVAAWQAGLNLAATVGRSLGGPLGGWLADTIGWRWSFLGQAPIFLLAVVLCWLFLPKGMPSSTHQVETEDSKPEDSKKSPLARIDFLGAGLLALFILAFLLPIEIGGTKVPWTHPLIFIFFGAAIVLGGLFAATEQWWAKEPIFPLEILKHRDVVLTYFITGAQVAAQLGLMFSVPLYFQVTKRVSNTVAGLHLFPAVAGNAIGGIMAGYLIKKTGRYKYLLVLATLASSLSYVLLLLRWHGDTNVWESLYILPGGLGAGLVQSAGFIAAQAGVNPKHKAAITSGIFLTVQIGMIIGLSSVSAVMMETMRWRLEELLKGMGLDALMRKTIIQKATSNVDFIDRTDSHIAQAVVQASFYDDNSQTWVRISLDMANMIKRVMMYDGGDVERIQVRIPAHPDSSDATLPLSRLELPELCMNCRSPYHWTQNCQDACGHCGQLWHACYDCESIPRNRCKCGPYPQRHLVKKCEILCTEECPKTEKDEPGKRPMDS
ncbi:major facilitator superfamily transporter [Colletotrichum sp. SAR11_240]|nr:major facilitator superfamily transporter [Colletotrichum sp. SAR11_240]